MKQQHKLNETGTYLWRFTKHRFRRSYIPDFECLCVSSTHTDALQDKREYATEMYSLQVCTFQHPWKKDNGRWWSSWYLSCEWMHLISLMMMWGMIDQDLITFHFIFIFFRFHQFHQIGGFNKLDDIRH